MVSPSEWTTHLLDHLDQARTGGLAGVSTGLRDLDTMTLELSSASARKTPSWHTYMLSRSSIQVAPLIRSAGGAAR